MASSPQSPNPSSQPAPLGKRPDIPQGQPMGQGPMGQSMGQQSVSPQSGNSPPVSDSPPALTPQQWSLQVTQLQHQLGDRTRPRDFQVGTNLELGNLFYQARNYSTALKYYETALNLAPTSIEALFGQGNALRHLQRYEEALVAYDQAILRSPHRIELWLNRGRTAQHLGRPEAALADFDRAIQFAPSDARIWQRRGDLLYSLERYGGAILSYAEAMARQPLQTAQIKTQCLCLDSPGPYVDRYRTAFAPLDEILATQPTHPQAWAKLAQALIAQGFRREALASVQKALQFYPPESVLAIAHLYQLQGQILGQLECWEEAVSSHQEALDRFIAQGDLKGEVKSRDSFTIAQQRLALQQEAALADAPPPSGFIPDILQSLKNRKINPFKLP